MSSSSHAHLPYACLLSGVCSDLPPGFKLGLLSPGCSSGVLCGCKFFIIIIIPGCVGPLSRCEAWAPGRRAWWLWCTGSGAPRHVGSPRPGLAPCPLRWQVGSSALSHQGGPRVRISHQTMLLSEHLLQPVTCLSIPLACFLQSMCF